MENNNLPKPAKKVKLLEGNDADEEGEKQMQVEIPNYTVLQSPITVPMLVPEVWANIFNYLPNNDLETVMNTCPEWNKLLEKEKPRILLQKVISNMSHRLTLKDAKTCRLVSKASKAGIEQAYPAMAQEIRSRCSVILKNAMLARVFMYVRRRAIIEQREKQGQPAWMDDEVHMQAEYEQQHVLFLNTVHCMLQNFLSRSEQE